jgi:hypothetical protein
MSARKLPPVTELGVASMALVVAGGISIAAKLPNDVNLTVPILFLAASSLVMAANVAALAGRPASIGTPSSTSRSGRSSRTP